MNIGQPKPLIAPAQEKEQQHPMSASILLVEDDQIARLALGKILAGAGYMVREAPDGESAVALLNQFEFDIVVTDLRLPGIDGIEVLKSAMALALPPSVLLLTGHGTLDTAIAALRVGAYDYLLKPCAPRALLEGVDGALRRRAATMRQAETIRNLAQGVAEIQRQLMTIGASEAAEGGAAQQTPTSRADTLAVGELQLGRFPHEARFANQQLHLTPIEHALLRCMAESRGEVLTYGEIVRHTHGFAVDETEAQALLKSHVRNVRRKLGVNIIANVRGVGYRLLEHPDENAAE